MLRESTNHPDNAALSDYIYGRLSVTDSAGIEQHIENCQQCCSVLEGYNGEGVDRALLSLGARQIEGSQSSGGSDGRVSAEGRPVSGVERYRISDQIGAGGMGQVFAAQDLQLNREVAIKTLPPGSYSSALSERFVREAKITAMLDHPGVPAAFERGEFPDGRPFLAMRLVNGQTLKSQLAGDRDQTFLLQVFEKLCECIAFAHSKKIVHRDIKPSNVMVGQFGEVQVMDWGLAKSVEVSDDLNGREVSVPSMREIPDEAGTEVAVPIVDATEVATEPNHSSTRFGTVLGTVAYMSPEQANGWISEIGPTGDVFSLGAVLCEILTGKPPYVAERDQERLRMARAAELAPAIESLKTCGADDDLIRIATTCLSVSVDARPNDAGVVAQKMADWRNATQVRLSEAKIAQARSETRIREEQKRRRIQLALIAASAVFGIVVWQIWAAKAAQADSFKAQENLRTVAETAECRGHLKLFHRALAESINDADADNGYWIEARAHLNEATGISEKHQHKELSADVERARDEFRSARAESIADTLLLEDLISIGGLKGTRDTLQNGRDGDGRRPRGGPQRNGSGLGGTMLGIRTNSASMADNAAQAFLDYGFDTLVATPEMAARHIQSRPQHFQEQIVGQLELWMHYAIVGRSSSARWACDLLQIIDPHPWRCEIRELMLVHDEEALADVARDQRMDGQPPEFAWSIAALLRGSNPTLAFETMSVAQINHMDNAVINRDLAHELERQGEFQQATVFLMLRAVTQNDDRRKARALIHVSDSFRQRGRYKETLLALRQALQCAPGCTPETRVCRAVSNLNDPEFAIGFLSEMIDKGELISADPWVELGDAYVQREEWQKARDAFRKGLQIGPSRPFRVEHANEQLRNCEAHLAVTPSGK